MLAPACEGLGWARPRSRSFRLTLRGQRGGRNRFRARIHHRFDGLTEERIAHVPAQITIGDHSDQAAVRVAYADAAKTFRGHDENRIRHARSRGGQRYRITLMHDVAYSQQPAPESAAGVKHAKIGGGEAFA